MDYFYDVSATFLWLESISFAGCQWRDRTISLKRSSFVFRR